MTAVGTRLTKADAGNKPGHVWDEERQEFIPLGAALAIERWEKPADLEANLKQFTVMRKAVLDFVGRQLEEAKYNDKGYPVPGQLGDYYTLPNYDKKQLTKRGGGKVAAFFRFAAGPITVIGQTKERDYCDATVSMVLLDHLGRTVGSAVSGCSTAESGFQNVGAKRKYGGRYTKEGRDWKELVAPDFRAALNDVTARARKRCFVQAVILATCTDEVFDVSTVDEHEPTETRSELPTKMLIGDRKGEKLTEIESAVLVKCAAWCRNKGKYEKLAEACELIVDDRRETEEFDGEKPY